MTLMPSDKGGEFCAIGLEDYLQLGRSHLAQVTTYRPVARMPAKTIEGKINGAWKSICRRRGISLRCERSFVSSSTRLPSFQHVIKTHKPGPQLKIRPIVSSRGGPTEKVTWLLRIILSPLLGSIPTHMPDSAYLMQALLRTTPQDRLQHQHQCSFDVEALYTSIPVEDALAAVQVKLGSGTIPAPMQVEDVVQLLRTVFSLTYFHFDGRVYQQIAGLPMGCSVSGITAIIFMEKIETRALATFARCPLFLRFVDDCYALVRDADEASELRDRLNEQHPNIRFELEHCEQHHGTTSLSLLDLTVRIDSGGLVSFNFFT